VTRAMSVHILVVPMSMPTINWSLAMRPMTPLIHSGLAVHR
jgi:hypothetical protein